MDSVIHRRGFLEIMGGLSLTASAMPLASETPSGNFYLLNHYYLRNSTQMPRINEFMERGLLPALKKVHRGPAIFCEALVAAHMPQFVTILGLSSIADPEILRLKLSEDEAFMTAFRAWEDGPEPPYEHYSQVLVRSTEYSPPIQPLSEPPKTPRLFELRVYHSPTWKQLRALHQRFAGPEIRIFHRVGVHPVLYGETVYGPNMPNLTYLTPFANLAARETAWNAFAADPEWVKVRKESIEANGQISSVMQITLLRATAYSPIR